MRPILCLAVLALGCGCSEQVELRVTKTQIIELAQGSDDLPVGSPALQVTFEVPDLPMPTEFQSAPPTALLYICGQQEKYWASSAITPDNQRKGVYRATFRAQLSKRFSFDRPTGRSSPGWPAALVDERGACFQVANGGMGGRNFKSNEVRLPGRTDVRP